MFLSISNAACAAYSGQIYLYGEAHGAAKVLDKEVALWSGYYRDHGMRHLFVELPYFTGEFLNLWMQSADDTLLDAVFAELEGTQGGNPRSLEFYKRIKRQCPETVFHGTDVGHQYASTGERFLKYLEDHQQKDSEPYRLAQENIAQGKNYYARNNDKYREDMMAANFRRELDRLGKADIMGIYGAAHTGVDALNYVGSGPSMAKQLKAVYGAVIHAEDLSPLAKDIEALRVDAISLGGKIYRASYFGVQDLKGFTDWDHREFWRLEGAYPDCKDLATRNDVLPYDNYPMLLEAGQVFVIDMTDSAGAVTRLYYRSDGGEWQGKPVTQQFEADR